LLPPPALAGTSLYNLTAWPVHTVFPSRFHISIFSTAFLSLRSFQFCELSFRSFRSFSSLSSKQPPGRFSLLVQTYKSQLNDLFFSFVENSIKMYTKAAALAILVAVAEARFGQEGLIQNLIQGLNAFGQPGQAGTLAGQSPGVLLAGANSCAKVSRWLLFSHTRTVR
jgi:hypothetical protein